MTFSHETKKSYGISFAKKINKKEAWAGPNELIRRFSFLCKTKCLGGFLQNFSKGLFNPLYMNCISNLFIKEQLLNLLLTIALSKVFLKPWTHNVAEQEKYNTQSFSDLY